jgi:hypothetical protein
MLRCAAAWALIAAQAAAQLAPALPGRKFAIPSAVPIAASDFTGDGAGDVTLAAAGAAGIYLLPGDGTGALGSWTFKLGGLFADDGIAVDLNGDAPRDLFTISSSIGAVTVHLGGASGLSAPTFTAVAAPLANPAAADVDHDGDQDVVLESAGGLRVLLGDGAGGIAPGSFYAGVAIEDLALAELSGDAHVDVAVATGSSIVIWTGDGAGGFAPTAPQATSVSPRGLEAVDLDLDGIVDLLASDVTAHAAWSFLRDGGLALPAVPIATSFSADAVELDVGDFDGDGVPDLAAHELHVLAFLAGAGDGSFGAPIELHTPTSGSFGETLIGDLNGDAALDTLRKGNAELAVFLGGGPDGIRAARSLDPGFATAALALADVDGDGDPDVLEARASPNEIRVLEGDGHGGASPGAQFATAASIEQILAGDLNGDGRLDVVAIDTAVLGGTAASFLADASGSYITGPTLDLLFSGLYPTLALADLTGDGVLDLVANTGYHAGAGGGAFGAPVAAGGNQGNFPGDLDGDGDLDLVGIQAPIFFDPGAVVTSLNDGSGAFSPAATVTMAVGPSWLALADFDEDADLDVFQNAPASSGAKFLAGLGNGMLAAPVLVPGLSNTTSIRPIARDFDRDGHLDVAIGWGDLARGNGAGAFPVVEPHAGLSSGDFTTASADSADWDGDGREDLVLSHAASGGTLFFRDQVPCNGTVTVYGSGCGGSGGFVPALDLLGCPEPAAQVKVRVQHGLGPALALVAVGAGQGQLALGNGCDLLVLPLYPGLTPLSLAGAGPGTGVGLIGAKLSPLTVPGSLFTLQAFVIDLGAPGFFAGSNAIEVVIQ